MAVKDIARDEAVSVAPAAPLHEVTRMMEDESIGSVIVVDDGDPVGIITDRDVAVRAVKQDVDIDGVEARDVMSENLLTVEGDEGVYDLTRMMAERGVRRVPVVEDGELAGIVTLNDLVILLSMEIQNISSIIRAGSPAYETTKT